MKLSELNIFRQYAKKLQVKSRTRSHPRPQILSNLMYGISFQSCWFHLITFSVRFYSLRQKAHYQYQSKEIKNLPWCFFSFFLSLIVSLYVIIWKFLLPFNELVIVQQITELIVLLMWYQRWSEKVDFLFQFLISSTAHFVLSIRKHYYQYRQGWFAE